MLSLFGDLYVPHTFLTYCLFMVLLGLEMVAVPMFFRILILKKREPSRRLVPTLTKHWKELVLILVASMVMAVVLGFGGLFWKVQNMYEMGACHAEVLACLFAFIGVLAATHDD